MALGSTQLLTETSTRNLPGGKGRPTRKADNLTAISELTVYTKCGSLKDSQPYGPPSVTGIVLHLLPLSFTHFLLWRNTNRSQSLLCFKMSVKSHLNATCFGITRPPSGNCSPTETAALHQLMHPTPSHIFALSCLCLGMNALSSRRVHVVPPSCVVRAVYPFSISHRVQTGSEAHPDTCPMGVEAPFPGLKRPGREDNH
jgi:hypothetical protein